MDLSNGPIMNWQPISVRNITPAIVKVEPSAVGSMASGPSFPHMPSVPRAASQVVPSLQASSVSQQTSSGLQSAQSEYVKVWEGNLYGQRQGQPVFITRLEGFRSASAFET
ncbi:mediator of RNA polymerase II transcription subunit 25-like [Camellia sinensis]|uniref:mediator of RNA polymerase II transcription subunit 25-like n=1 Tax=Camellia sinensis TaxID=4442 RepID=UPI001036C308|nr:mediator of RNA polymerase II transcription subunit 25-like [Camellia sinensis]XP_028089569.1 mediator of RNA polymerase II transcription subunit 25-like [Camellia sinensis]XP_028089570.1 mediator of RNA polymerase II transcription subunit 25-like [Camellia sinensis]XP_028089571.1 mediator of RNA polymerase II transcription subunit 25-like [Camellia sinensis]XP_028089572.1 mediator of RNA polymerase II transcription subunit 25-like [Camellia sinensis]